MVDCSQLRECYGEGRGLQSVWFHNSSDPGSFRQALVDSQLRSAQSLPCPAESTIVDPGANYALNNPAAYIGQFFTFYQSKVTPYPNTPPYFALNLTPQATDCPSSSAPPAGSCNKLGSTAYHDNIACANTALTLSCGDTVNVLPNTGSPSVRNNTEDGTQCLIHTTDNGNPNPPPNSCTTDPDPDCFAVSGLPLSPVTINGGASNRNPLMRVANISRSDSIVTVPIFDYQTAANTPCPGGVCGAATVTGFLQLGIQSVSFPPNPKGAIGAVILNASGCNPASAGNPRFPGAALHLFLYALLSSTLLSAVGLWRRLDYDQTLTFPALTSAQKGSTPSPHCAECRLTPPYAPPETNRRFAA